MKNKVIFLTLLTFLTLPIFSKAFFHLVTDPIIGAWGHGSPSSRTVIIITEKIISVSMYNLSEKKFISTKGGAWHRTGEKILVRYEWNSTDTSQVANGYNADIHLKDGKLFFGKLGIEIEPIDQSLSSDVTGAWIISWN